MSYTYQNFASLPVNLNRQAYGALDISQVFTNENDLKYYVSKGAYVTDVSEYWYKSADEKVVPYPYAGQYLALVDNETRKVTAYILEERAEEDVNVAQGKYAFSYKEVGITPVGDDKTIDVDATGKITVHGIEGKTSGTYVPQLVKGELVWSVPSNITVDGLNANLTGLTERVTNLEDKDEVLEEAVGAAQDAADANAEAITALQAKDVELANADTTLGNRVTAVEQTLNGTPATGSEEDGDYVAAVPGLVSKVATLEDEMSGAKDALDQRYTKEQVHTYVAEQIGNQAHFSAQVVDSIDKMTDTTVLYLLKKTMPEGTADVYEQYIVLTDAEGAKTPTLIGETSIDLTPYATDDELQTAINGVVDAYTAADSTLDGRITALQQTINGLDATYDAKYATIETVNSKADQTDLDETNDAVDELSGKVDGLEGKAHTHDNKKVLDGITSDKVAAWDEAEKNVIHSANEDEFTVIDRELSIKAVAQSKVTGLAGSLQALQDGIDGKVSKEDGKELISSADLAKLAKLNSDGTLAATAVTGLSDWISANRGTVDGLMSADEERKLSTIAEGAQANVIEVISVAGEQILPTNKIVEIASASNTVYGVVKGTAAMNMVSINEDKAMEVHSLNVTKLVQDENTVLILNGGNA